MMRWRVRGAATAGLLALGLAWTLAGACAPPGVPPPPAPAAAASVAAPATSPPAPEPTKLNLHHPSRSTSYLPWYLAIEQGYFREQGLAVEILQAPATVGLTALLTGDMHFSGVVSSALPAIVQGAPFKVVWIQSAKANYWLTTRPEIHTLADLRGQRVVVPSLGMQDAYTRLLATAMRRAGMDPADDVTFIAAGSSGGGGSDILVGAMAAGAADAMVGNVLQRLAAESLGFHTIYSFGEQFPDLQGGLVTTEGMLRDRPEVAQRFLTAAVKAIRVMEHDPATSLDVLLKYVPMDRTDAANGLSWIRPLMAKDGLITATEQHDGLVTFQEAMPETAELTTSRVFDFGPLQDAIRSVDASGWKP
jgi:NitT/TauT family transport system substrate-binding protein